MTNFLFFLLYFILDMDESIEDKQSNESYRLSFIRSQRNAPLLVQDGYIYRCERFNDRRSYWLCICYKKFKCNGRLICEYNDIIKSTTHVHEVEPKRLIGASIEYKNLHDEDSKEYLKGLKKAIDSNFSKQE